MTDQPEFTPEQRKIFAKLEKLMKERDRLLKYHKMWAFDPYPKQCEFFDLGLMKMERLLRAGNQLGKTEAGGFETACHLTGEYPDWWLGKRYDRPVTWWAAGEGALLTRNGPQQKLCGKPGVADLFGTGYIPLEAFADKPTLSRGVTDAYDTIQVWHKTNGKIDGVSTCRFLSYDQGREKFQSESVDGIWCDEEPPEDIYNECLARLTATKGIIFTTFTPLKGANEVVRKFMDNPNGEFTGEVCMTVYDVRHLTPEDITRMKAIYPKYQHNTRLFGVPMQGEGAVFPYSEESLHCAVLEHVPMHWTKLWGIDFGIGHPFGAALTMWDKDNDVLYVIATVRVSDQLPLQHAYAMKLIAAGVPVAWPHDGHDRDKGSGEQLSKQYKQQGLLMLPTHAQFEDGSNSTEAGVLEMAQRMETGRFKVYAHLGDWWDEFRGYHRKDGMIVKVRDDLMSATRMAVMAKRYGKPVPLGPGRARRKGVTMASGLSTELDPWGRN